MTLPAATATISPQTLANTNLLLPGAACRSPTIINDNFIDKSEFSLIFADDGADTA